MWNPFVKKRESILDKPIDRVLSDMDTYGPDSEEYSKLMNYLESLTKMKGEEHRNRISPDTMVIVAGNILGILIIVLYEQKHVLTSKGLGLIRMKEPR